MLLLSFPLSAQENEVKKAVEPTLESMAVGSVLQMLFGLVLVVLLILVCAWLVKRLGRFQGGITEQLRVVGGLHVGQRERVVLIQVGEKQVLIGIAPGNINTLYVLDEPLTMNNTQTENTLAGRFSDIFNKQIKQ